MRKPPKLLAVLGLLCGLTGSAHAELVDNGDGTIADTSTRLVWLKNANQAGRGMTFEEANAWAENLHFAGFADWHLPSGANPDGTVCNSRPTSASCTETEFGSLYFAEDVQYVSPEPFTIVDLRYWTSTEWPADPTRAMSQDFMDGGQIDSTKDLLLGAWAVRSPNALSWLWWQRRGTFLFVLGMATLAVVSISVYLRHRSRQPIG